MAQNRAYLKRNRKRDELPLSRKPKAVSAEEWNSFSPDEQRWTWFFSEENLLGKHVDNPTSTRRKHNEGLGEI